MTSVLLPYQGILLRRYCSQQCCLLNFAFITKISAAISRITNISRLFADFEDSVTAAVVDPAVHKMTAARDLWVWSDIVTYSITFIDLKSISHFSMLLTGR
jgi:hypothetical protein